MRWPPGTSGNANGRPPGTGKVAKLRAQLENHKQLPDLVNSLVNRAMAGDMAAAKIVMDRVLPALKPEARPVFVALDVHGKLTDQAREVLKVMSQGQLAPDVGAQILASLGSISALKVDELEAQIRAELNKAGEEAGSEFA